MNARLVFCAALAMSAAVWMPRSEAEDGAFDSLYWKIVDHVVRHYGNYCGPGWTYGGPESLLCPLPVDDSDALCAIHDSLYRGPNDDNQRGSADLELARGFLAADLPPSLYGFTYTTVGSAVLPLQAGVWTLLSLDAGGTDFSLSGLGGKSFAYDRAVSLLGGNTSGIDQILPDAGQYRKNERAKGMKSLHEREEEMWRRWSAEWEEKKTYSSYEEWAAYWSAFSEDHKRMRDEIQMMKKAVKTNATEKISVPPSFP